MGAEAGAEAENYPDIRHKNNEENQSLCLNTVCGGIMQLDAHLRPIRLYLRAQSVLSIGNALDSGVRI
jgi:hypothetical protein